MTDTNVNYSKEDVGKNLYRRKTYYTLTIEQEVLANDRDDADNLFLDNGGIDHSKITTELVESKGGVETYMVDANYSDSNETEYVGKVKYDDDTQSFEDAMENGDIHIDRYASEDEPHQLTKIKLTT
jgi:hypothetical protein